MSHGDKMSDDEIARKVAAKVLRYLAPSFDDHFWCGMGDRMREDARLLETTEEPPLLLR